MSIVNEKLVEKIMSHEAMFFHIFDHWNTMSSKSRAVAMLDVFRQLENKVNREINIESQERRADQARRNANAK